MNTITERIDTILPTKNSKVIVFYVLISALVSLSVVYVYLIGSITFNILARKTLEKKLYSLSSHVSNLELAYLNDLNKIDKNYALSIGYVNTKDVIFANRTVTSVAIR